MNYKIYNNLKSETARSIYKGYVKKYGIGAGSIFANADEIEHCIDLAIKRGATGSEIAKETINYLYA